MYMNSQLVNLYPNLTIQSTYMVNVPDTSTYVPPNCPPILEQWARQGYDLIVATSFGYQWCAASLAAEYPNTVFLGINQNLPPLLNYGRGNVKMYQVTYLAGVIAGHMTKTGIVCSSMPGPWGDAVGHFSAFALGVARVNASIPVHVGWSLSWRAPLHDILVTRYMFSIGCDVIFSRMNGLEGLQVASDLGMLGIGFNADYQLLVGERILTSPAYIWGPMYLEVAQMVIEGTFAAAPVNLFPGFAEGAVMLTELSYLVPDTVASEVTAITAALTNGTFDVFCGVIPTNDGVTVGSPDTCITGDAAQSLTWYPANVIDSGNFFLPSQVCSPGEEALFFEGNHSYVCLPCPGGTYSMTSADANTENMTCVPCPPGEYSAPNSTACALCPTGTTIAPHQDTCFPSHSDPGAIIGGVTGACGFVVLGIVTLATLLLLKSARNNLAAPKNPNKPFCILFTDIQSSTHLWATAPEEMAQALNAHHALIRRLINKFGCYEVKTIGDSFMCAVQSPEQAVGFALAVQREFHAYDWGSGAINNSYRKILHTEVPGLVSPSCWNGLRVRVGIHYGMGDILRDPVSKGFDYYGTVVNTAARIESVCHGGQVAVSHAVYKELDGRYPDSVWPDLGSHALRGLSEPLHLFQILPGGPLEFREFPPLRTDREDQMVAQLDAEQQECGDDLEVIHLQPAGKLNRVGIASLDREAKDNLGWTETHPLVLRGDLTAEDLRKVYTVSLSAVSTLLATQTRKARETVVPLFCDRLHVRSWGSEGHDLQRTLRALVLRVLPAVVRANSCMGDPTSHSRDPSVTTPNRAAAPMDAFGVGSYK